MTTVRLQKILARGGLASRRHAEELITAGRVRVNGHVVTELGSKADPTKDKIEVDGKKVMAESFVYVVLHKPRGVVATLSDPEGRPTVRDSLKNVPGRVYPVGRLDFATSGVLLVTNDGEFSEGLLHPRKQVPKTYVVKSTGEMKDKDLERWRKGLRLEDGMTLPADVKFLRHEGGKTWFELTIREGRNQQIRRMGDASGFPVMRLARLSFAGVTSEDLRPGDWRYLTREELVALRKEYGVPKRMPSLPAAAANAPAARAKRPAARSAPSRSAPSRSAPSRSAPSRSTPSQSTPAKSPKPQTSGPRYGGGSPGRRSVDVQDDWAGGAGRGRSSGRYADIPADRPSRGGHSARTGTTRTTGSSGGVAAGEGEYRISRTRRGR